MKTRLASLSSLRARNLAFVAVFSLALIDYHALEAALHRSSHARERQVSQDATSVQLRVLSYNAFLRPGPISFLDENDCRAERIGEEVVRDLPDIAVFSEAFAENATARMARTMRETFPHFRMRLPARAPLVYTNGGIAVFSRFPVETWSAQPFETCAGWIDGLGDCVASKGFVHALVRVNSTLKLNVIATHMDAGLRVEDRTARAIQFKQINQYVEDTEVFERWPTVFAGDFNINGLAATGESADEYRALMQSLQTPVDAALASFKSGSQNALSTMNCAGGGLVDCQDTRTSGHGNERLDYVFVLGRKVKSVLRADLLPIATDHLAMRDDSCGTTFLSDHRAVSATLQLTR